MVLCGELSWEQPFGPYRLFSIVVSCLLIVVSMQTTINKQPQYKGGIAVKRYRTANLICFFSLLFLLVSLWLKMGSPWQGADWTDWVYFMAQSCCIGCAADWIAVEALFRKHSFFPIKPLIPANRARIIQKVVEMNQSLLSPKNLLAKISHLSLTELCLPWLTSHRESISQTLATKGATYAVEFLSSHREEIATWGRSESRKWLPVFISFAQGRLKQEMNRETWLLRLLEEGKRKIEEPSLRYKLAEQLRKAGDQEEKGWLTSIGYTLGKCFGVIDYDQLAEAALDALVEEMEAWKREDNPFHQELLSQWDLLIARFLQEPATLEALQEFGRGLFEAFPLEKRIDEGISDFQHHWGKSALEEKLKPAMEQSISFMEGNAEFRQKLDTIGRDLIAEIIIYEHGFLSWSMIEVLESFREEELNEFIESKVYRELEGIRINGAAVGLVAGLLFYGFLTWAWIPLVENLFS